MPREILIAWAGRHQRPTWEALCEDYRRRIVRAVPVRDLPVKARSAGEGKARRQAEGRALLAALPEPCFTVALDPRAKARSSPDLAAWWGELRDTWPHPIAFLIGSDLGLAPDLLSQTRERLSFGPMTFGHELARLILYEQLYRAISIGRGINYHRTAL
jgi:23S rRNA (pseudouridine1915-N3)-methyltransferase